MVFEKVREILCEQLDIPEEEVTLDSNIVDDFGADSLDIVDFIMSLDEEFDREIPDEDVEKIKTVGDIVSYKKDFFDILSNGTLSVPLF